MKKEYDLTGQKFAKLTVLKFDGYRYYNCGTKESVWLCQCDCGNILSVPRSYLIRGKKRSCGCEYVPQNELDRFYYQHRDDIYIKRKDFFDAVNALPHANEPDYRLEVINPLKDVTPENVMWCTKPYKWHTKYPRNIVDYKLPLWNFLKGFIALAGYKGLTELAIYTKHTPNTLAALKNAQPRFIKNSTLKDICEACSMSTEDRRLAYEILDSCRKNFEYDTYRGNPELLKIRIKNLMSNLDLTEQKEFIKELEADATI